MESAAARVTRTSSAPLPLMVPANTREAASTASERCAADSTSVTATLSTGTLSPVIGA